MIRLLKRKVKFDFKEIECFFYFSFIFSVRLNILYILNLIIVLIKEKFIELIDDYKLSILKSIYYIIKYKFEYWFIF
jgi:hypothetical protein